MGWNTLLLTAHTYGIDKRTARQLIADDFHISIENVIVIRKPDHHIDLYLRAGAAGEVFVASQAAGEQLLGSLVVIRSPGIEERTALEALHERVVRVNASPVGHELERKLEAIRGLMQKSGFDVIDYPSLYYSYIQTVDPDRRSRP